MDLTKDLEIVDNINLILERGVSTKVGIVIKNKSAAVKTVNIQPSCGCVIAESFVTLEPYEVKFAKLMITRMVSGLVIITFQNDQELYYCHLNIEVK